jgi:hypothetical protein
MSSVSLGRLHQYHFNIDQPKVLGDHVALTKKPAVVHTDRLGEYSLTWCVYVPGNNPNQLCFGVEVDAAVSLYHDFQVKGWRKEYAGSSYFIAYPSDFPKNHKLVPVQPGLLNGWVVDFTKITEPVKVTYLCRCLKRQDPSIVLPRNLQIAHQLLKLDNDMVMETETGALEFPSCLLTYRSEPFRVMISEQNSFQESLEKKVRWTNWKRRTMEHLIYYLRHDDLPTEVTVNECQELAAFGHQWCVDGLMYLASAHGKQKKLGFETCVTLYQTLRNFCGNPFVKLWWDQVESELLKQLADRTVATPKRKKIYEVIFADETKETTMPDDKKSQTDELSPHVAKRRKKHSEFE